jgi:hypothetical protein
VTGAFARCFAKSARVADAEAVFAALAARDGGGE